MNRYIKIILFCLPIALVTSSCDKDFETINQNPNSPTSVPSDLLIADIVRVAANQNYSSFVGMDMGACWSQQLSKVQYNDEERYGPRVNVIQGVWNTYYEAVIADAKTMYDLAVVEENTASQGVALTLQAYGYLMLTDMYGDIPFSESILAPTGNVTPAYDTQEAVYDGALQMLTDASALLAAGGSINGSADIMYGGSVSNWNKFANSLKFRALMRISGVRNVAAELQALVSAGNMFTSNADEAKLVYLAASPNANPIYETVVFGTRLEYKLNQTLVDKLSTDGDPRLAVYVAPNADGIYRGKPAGISDVPSNDWGYDNVSGIGAAYLDPTAPGYFMSYAQLELLKAEAAVKGYISGNAATYFENGVNASMAANGLTDVVSASSVTLKDIAEQEWIALFCQGIESWVEQRRTGFPVLAPAQDGFINAIPSRYTYPTGEQSLNATSYQAAVARQGEDRLTTKMWWNK